MQGVISVLGFAHVLTESIEEEDMLACEAVCYILNACAAKADYCISLWAYMFVCLCMCVSSSTGPKLC